MTLFAGNQTSRLKKHWNDEAYGVRLWRKETYRFVSGPLSSYSGNALIRENLISFISFISFISTSPSLKFHLADFALVGILSRRLCPHRNFISSTLPWSGVRATINQDTRLTRSNEHFLKRQCQYLWRTNRVQPRLSRSALFALLRFLAEPFPFQMLENSFSAATIFIRNVAVYTRQIYLPLETPKREKRTKQGEIKWTQSKYACRWPEARFDEKYMSGLRGNFVIEVSCKIHASRVPINASD